MALLKGHEDASFIKRTISFLLDIIVINLIILWPFENSLAGYLNHATKNMFNLNNAMPSQVYVIILIMSLLALFYFAFFEYYLGQSPGQMLLGIRVMAASNISMWKAIVRNCYIIPFFPFYILWILDPVYLAFYRQRFLERITGTMTVMDKAKYYQEYKLQKI